MNIEINGTKATTYPDGETKSVEIDGVRYWGLTEDISKPFYDVVDVSKRTGRRYRNPLHKKGNLRPVPDFNYLKVDNWDSDEYTSIYADSTNVFLFDVGGDVIVSRPVEDDTVATLSITLDKGSSNEDYLRFGLFKLTNEYESIPWDHLPNESVYEINDEIRRRMEEDGIDI